MAELVVMYKTPKDTAAFDAYYFEKHVPIARKIPGLRKYQVSRGPVATPAGPSSFHLIATLTFDDLAAIQAAFASAEGAGRRGRCANLCHRRRRHDSVRYKRGVSTAWRAAAPTSAAIRGRHAERVRRGRIPQSLEAGSNAGPVCDSRARNLGLALF